MVNFEWNLSQHNLFKLWKSLNFMYLNLFELKKKKKKNWDKNAKRQSLWTTLVIKIVYYAWTLNKFSEIYCSAMLTNLLFRINLFSENNVHRAKSVCNCCSSDWLQYARNGNNKSWWTIIEFWTEHVAAERIDCLQANIRFDQKFFVISEFIITCIKWIHLMRKLVL